MPFPFFRSTSRETARLLETVQELQAERDELKADLQGHKDALGCLRAEHDLLRAALGILQPWKTRRQLAEALRELVFRPFGLSGFSVLEVAEESKQLGCLYYFEAGACRDYPPRNYEQDPGLTGWVIHHRRPLYLRTAAEADALQAIFSPPEIDSGLRPATYYGIPLCSDAQVLAVLAFMSYPQDDFSEGKRGLMDALACMLTSGFYGSRSRAAVRAT